MVYTVEHIRQGEYHDSVLFVDYTHVGSFAHAMRFMHTRYTVANDKLTEKEQ